MTKKLLNSEKTSSGILASLLASFLAIVLAMLLTWFISLEQIERVSGVVSDSQTVTQKMTIISKLMETARTRTRLTMQMIHTEDIFDRDEINIELDRKAAEFAHDRATLMELGLTDKEKQQFEILNNLIRPALAGQREAAELALSDDAANLKKASHILLHDVYPIQGKVVDIFSVMLNDNKQYIHDSSNSLLEQIAVNRKINFAIFSAIIGISFIIIFYVIRHITTTAKDLHKEKERAQSTIRSLGDAVITTDINGTIEYVNKTAETLIGRPANKLIGKALQDGFKAHDKTRNVSIADAAFKLIKTEDMDPLSRHITLYSFDDIEYEITVAISPIVDIYGKTNGVIISFHDVTQSQELLKKIQYQATHDALTGLLNRREFESRVSKALALYDDDATHAMGLIDLDSFKAVNDSCGHAAGDQLLRQLSDYIKPKLRRSDFLARLGGDEFGVFLPNVEIDEAHRVVDSILEAIKAFQFAWDNKHFRVGASIGMIEVPALFTDYNYLYKAVDTACYLAKNSGRNQIKLVHVDDDTITQKAVESDWINKINHALENDGFILCGQAIESLSLRTKGRKHTEVLIRMLDDKTNIISPMAFIPVAERYSMMDKIDLWVFRKICQLIKDTPLDHTIYAVNLSGQTLSSSESMHMLQTIAEEMELQPGRLCLEITETVAIANIEQARGFMETMQNSGCYIALDDFGSGLSSFSYLKDLPLDYIKIDGAFVKSITTDKASLVMIEAIHNVGKKLGLITVAEFIETEEVLKELVQIGIDMGQGYYFQKPQPLEYFNYRLPLPKAS